MLWASQNHTIKYMASLPNLENVWKLADHFGVSIDYLVGRSDER